MTTFADQLFHLGGIPVGGAGTLPVMGYDPIGEGAQTFFVHGNLGNDGNDGKTPATALKTLTTAYGLCRDGRGDVVYILNDGSTTASVRDVALTWAKDNCHIVGLAAPAINSRARIAPSTSITDDVDAYTPFLTLSASGCCIMNISWYQGQSENKASVGVKVSGSRNYFYNVSIVTGAHATQANNAIINLQVTGQENVFEKCFIGCDTAARGGNTISSNVRFGSDAADGSCRNVFRSCIFPMFADDTEPVFIYSKTAFDTDRWNLFENCTFINTGTSSLAAGVNWADTTGKLFLQNCGFYGCDNVTAADSSYVFLLGPTPGTPVDVGLFQSVDVA